MLKASLLGAITNRRFSILSLFRRRIFSGHRWFLVIILPLTCHRLPHGPRDKTTAAKRPCANSSTRRPSRLQRAFMNKKTWPRDKQSLRDRNAEHTGQAISHHRPSSLLKVPIFTLEHEYIKHCSKPCSHRRLASEAQEDSSQQPFRTSGLNKRVTFGIM